MELNAFVQLVSEFRRDGDSEEEILEAFRVFDPQFTGVVSVAQLRQVMMNYWYSGYNGVRGRVLQDPQSVHTRVPGDDELLVLRGALQDTQSVLASVEMLKTWSSCFESFLSILVSVSERNVLAQPNSRIIWTSTRGPEFRPIYWPSSGSGSGSQWSGSQECTVSVLALVGKV